MFNKIGKLTANYPKTILVIWLVLIIASFSYGSHLNDHLGGGTLEIEGSESNIANEIIREQFSNVSQNRLIIVIEGDGISATSDEFKQFTEEIEQQLTSNSHVTKTESPFSTPYLNLLDETNDRAFIFAELDMGTREEREFIRSLKQDFADNEQQFQIYITGTPGMNLDASELAKKNVSKVELIGLPIVFILLLFVFRSPIAAILPVLLGVFSVSLSMSAALIITSFTNLSTLLTNIITMLGLGVSIDYALFIIKRFREQLSQGMDVKSAVIEAIATSGRAVFYAGTTVGITVISILIADTAFTRSIAIGGSIVVIASIIVSLTLLPALLMIIGKKIDWLRFDTKRKSEQDNPLVWRKLIDWVLKRPVISLIAALIPLLLCSIPFLQLKMQLPVAAYHELPEKTESRVGMDYLMEHIDNGSVFPVQLLLTQTNEQNVFASDSVAEIERLSALIANLPHVKEVTGIHSLITNQTPAAYWEQAYQAIEEQPEQVKYQLQQLISKDGKSTMLRIAPDTHANSDETRSLVRQIRDEILPQISSGFVGRVTGETAIGLDYDEEIISNLPYVVLLVVILTYILLYIAFRSVLIPLKAILMNGIVTTASMGFIVLMYQYGYMPGAEAIPLSVNTPLTLFVLLFGLSMDYEVILISRMKERYDKTNKHMQSVTDGIVTTAGMVTGAASIMIVVFGVFLFADFQLVQELGVGLAFAILIDAFIIRTILVPIFMKLFGHINWYGFRKIFLSKGVDS